MYQDDQTLIDILNFARLAVKFMKSSSFEEFVASETDRICVTHELLMLGEACRRLSNEFRDLHTEIDWLKWTRLRNSIIHVYHRVNNLEIYQVVKNDLPDLISAVENLAPKPENE
jgi:uncharacterized protein with HEPN domain